MLPTNCVQLQNLRTGAMSTRVWFVYPLNPQLGHRNPWKSNMKASLIDYPLASKIMVKNLSYSTTESLLKKEFSNFGQIAEVKLVMDEKAKRPKGYAFIQYTCQDDAILALESMDYEFFDGRLIYVEFAKPERNFNTHPITSGPPQQQNALKDDNE